MDTHTHSDAHDLRHHGDAEVRDEKLIDLAVNVRTNTPPDWLRKRIADSLTGLAAYPDGRAARAAVAVRHDLPPGRVLLTAGAAEAFVLLARARRRVGPWWCTRSSPSRRRRCATPGTRWAGCCCARRTVSGWIRRRCPRTRTWW